MSGIPPNRNAVPGPPLRRRATKPGTALPGASKFSLDDALPIAGPSVVQQVAHNVASDSTVYFRTPITPLSAPRAFTRQTDVNTLNHASRQDAPLLEPLDDPREPIAPPDPIPDFSALYSFPSPPPTEVLTPFVPKPRVTRYQRIHNTLTELRESNISPVEVLIQILDPSDIDYDRYRTHLYSEGSTKLSALLETIMSNDAGKRKLLECMRPHLADFACQIVAEQMEERRVMSTLPGIGAITPEFIDGWSIDEELNATPFLTRILETAAQTPYATAHNKIKTPQKVRGLILHIDEDLSRFQAEFGLFLWSTGCARQTIDALFRCGLSVSCDSVLNLIESLSHHCDSESFRVSQDIHAFNYDNMNLSTSIFVEQRGSSGPSKASSGTFGVLYRLRNAVPEHMLITPIMKRWQISIGLHFNRDIKPSLDQLTSFHDQILVVIMRSLTTHQKGFEYIVKDPLLQHKERRAIPVGYKSDHYPLRATTIEQATVRGNLLFHDEIYLNQLRRTSESLSKYAIPSFNDQLTRAKDTNAWNRREIFQLGFGLFHLCLNPVWGLLHVHRGSINDTGSLAYFFALMEKARLGNDQPDYHTLLAALTQILDGLLIGAWRRECGSGSLKEFAESKPTAEQLRKIATHILNEYATPIPTPTPSELEPASDDSSSDSAEDSASDAECLPSPVPHVSAVLNPKDDVAHHNIRLLTRDLLIVAALIRAISDGDIGRVEDFLPQLAMIFRGSGCNKYCTEILHFLHNLKDVWTPEFADIMRDNMIICLSGLGPGHCMPMDLNIEHLIGYLKILLQAKGMASTWDRLGNISAAIVHLQRVKKKVSEALDTAYRNTGHTTPDTSEMVWRVANKVTSEGLQLFEDGRANNARRKLVPDLLLKGENEMKSSTLATFNKKILAMIEGHGFEDEEDDPAMAFGTAPNPD
ncbi:hypothetical protein FB451DRAFT_1467611 [Mycena latifolia]|nr:hypothetical protein FB451DRAFT_1467611 [Mycena latifolia]